MEGKVGSREAMTGSRMKSIIIRNPTIFLGPLTPLVNLATPGSLQMPFGSI